MDSKTFQLVDFVTPDGALAPGLVPVPKNGIVNSSLNVDEQAAIHAASFFDNIDYVFFRRFSDCRSSQVSAYVIDNSNNIYNREKLSELHRQVWLSGLTPLIYVAWPGRIDILSCARGPDFWEDQKCFYNPAINNIISTADSITRELNMKYSALRLADGTFWEEPSNRGLADYEKAAHQMLMQAVVEADIELKGKENPVLRRLLLLMILIKYLEDRKVFPSGFFGKFHKGSLRFLDVLKSCEPEKVNNLLNTLERKFDGDIFSLPYNGQQLTDTSLKTFAKLIEARTLGRQRYLWEQFSFEHLPVEIISHLYQRFVQEGDGAVYTPPFLASLLLDHVMPYDKVTGNERIVDPACGSGVFLVGAFRRLINVWRSNNNWQELDSPKVNVLKKILKKNIFGIEVDTNAIDLTIFSLSLAICDALQPNIIWEKLKFDLLRNSNLFEHDFFEIILDSQKINFSSFDKGFDVVIGNPPFKSKLSTAGKKIDKIAERSDPNRGSVPDNQMAYLFLEQSLKILCPGGRVCLIQPHGLLYNRNCEKFRRYIFRKHEIDTIFDFTSIRGLYQADPKTISVLALSNHPLDNHLIKHWTFRRTVTVKERLCFELDYYDRHHISQQQALTDPSIWRANLLGGGRLIDLSQRLQKMGKLCDYIKRKEWGYGEGFIVGKKNRSPAPFLTNKPLLPTKAFTDDGIDKTKIEIVKDKLFNAPRNEARYSAPLVLIKEVDSLPIDFWDDGFLAYRHRIVGIHAPPDQKRKLIEFYKYFKDNLNIYRLACALNGTPVGWATAIQKIDIDSLPDPDDLRDFSLSFWEKALSQDVLDHMTKYVRLGQNSELLEKMAGEDDLIKYSTMFTRMLGTVYNNLCPSDPIFLNGLVCQQFYFKEPMSPSKIDNDSTEILRRLIYDDEKYEQLRSTRVLRFYYENIISIIKPDRLRFWISSTAIRDADDTLIDLHLQGY